MTNEVNCPVEGCDFKPKNKRSLAIHAGLRHAGAKLQLPDAVAAAEFVPSKIVAKKSRFDAEEVIFYSARRPSMTVIVVPEQWREVTTPAGAKMVQSKGKLAQFEAGQFRTTDVEIIDYLENTYNDPRFPILSNRQIRAMAAQ